MAVRIKLTIQVQSDFHVGTGTGRGRATDAVFLSDEQGLPYIPGSTIKGLARVEAKELITLYHPHLGPVPDEKSFESSTFYEVFGGGNADGFAEDRVFFEDARLLTTFPLADVARLRTGRSARDRISGVAKQDHLFFYEDAPAATFEARLTSDTNLSPVALLLLLLSIRRIEALGGQRRRGKGRVECTVEVEDSGAVEFQADEPPTVAGPLTLPHDSWREVFVRFAKPILKGTVARGDRFAAPSLAIRPCTSRTKNVCWLVYAVAESPLALAHDRAVDNVIESADFISGTTVRGAVAWDWLRQGVPATDPVFTEAIANEKVAFGPLYPVKENWGGHATMPFPTPASIYTCKRYPGALSDSPAHHGVADRFSVSMSQRCKQPGCNAALSSCGGYLQLAGDDDRDLTLDHANVTLRVLQRNDVDNAQLFGIEAIPRGTWFAGYVWGPEHLLEAILSNWKSLWRSLRVGKVRTRGLGLLSMQCVPAVAESHETFPNLLQEGWAADFANKDEFFLTLYSDTIALDQWMRPVTQLDAAELWRQINGSGSVPFRMESGYVATRRIGGYLGAVGLPRTADVALQAGSTWKLKWTNTEAQERQFAANKLLHAQSIGIGFRRAEGFGRVIVNCPVHLIANDLLSNVSFHGSCVTEMRPRRKSEVPRHLQGAENWMVVCSSTVQDRSGYRRLLHECSQAAHPASALEDALKNSKRTDAGKRESLTRFVDHNRQRLFGEREIGDALHELQDKPLESGEIKRFIEELIALAEGR